MQKWDAVSSRTLNAPFGVTTDLNYSSPRETLHDTLRPLYNPVPAVLTIGDYGPGSAKRPDRIS